VLSGREHDGKIYELNGPGAINYTELAVRISKVAGREVKYLDIPMDAQKKAILEQGTPEWLATALLDLQQYYLNGKGGERDGLLQKLLGRAPVTMDEFLQENAAEFRPQAAKA
jgi:NAD(P)H dehydrogenase (quinone)